MLASLPALKETVQSHVAAQDELHAAGSHVERLQHQVTYLEEALHDSQHAFYTLPHRCVALVFYDLLLVLIFFLFDEGASIQGFIF